MGAGAVGLGNTLTEGSQHMPQMGAATASVSASDRSPLRCLSSRALSRPLDQQVSFQTNLDRPFRLAPRCCIGGTRPGNAISAKTALGSDWQKQMKEAFLICVG